MKRLVLGGLMISLAISGGLALLASGQPDGLEHSMETVGARSADPVHPAPMPDYEAPFLSSPVARQVVAGVSGTLAVFGLVTLVGWLLQRSGRGRRAKSA